MGLNAKTAVNRTIRNIFAALFISIGLVSCKKEVTAEIVHAPLPQTFDIIIVAGQSNTCYGYGYDSSLMIPSGVMELGRFDKDYQIIPATPSLNNHSQAYIKSSFGYDFARYYEESEIKNKKQPLLIACGAIGTTFFENDWNKGDELYNDLIARTNHVITKYPGSRVVAILWQHGESDMFNSNYKDNLDSMIVNMRRDIMFRQVPILDIPFAKPIPFFLGGMVPYWTNLKSYRVDQQNIIANTERRLPDCYFVDPSGIEKPDNNVDTIHYSHENQTALAIKYWERFIDVSKKGQSTYDLYNQTNNLLPLPQF